jgi:hypothetical protein
LGEQITLIHPDRRERIERQIVKKILILREERSFTKEFITRCKDRKSDRDRPIAEIRFLIGELQALLPITDTDRDGQDLAASCKVVGRILKSKRRSAKTAGRAVERDLLASFLANLDGQVNVTLLFVRAGLDVLIFVDRVKVLRLVYTRDRDLKPVLVIDVAFVQQEFEAKDAVALKCVASKLQPAKSELFALVDVDADVDDALVRIIRIVLEIRLKLGVKLNESL